jgi:hypothetical protein
MLSERIVLTDALFYSRTTAWFLNLFIQSPLTHRHLGP